MLKMSCNGVKGNGTPEYASPDLTIDEEMSEFTDIWSLGVILYKIIFRRHPLYRMIGNFNKNISDFYDDKFKISFTVNENTAPFL